MAALHGVQARALPGPRGEVPVEVLEAGDPAATTSTFRGRA